MPRRHPAVATSAHWRSGTSLPELQGLWAAFPVPLVASPMQANTSPLSLRPMPDLNRLPGPLSLPALLPAPTLDRRPPPAHAGEPLAGTGGQLRDDYCSADWSFHHSSAPPTTKVDIPQLSPVIP